MSKIDSNGLEHGKRGNNIYVGLNNQQVKKGLYRPTNPRTLSAHYLYGRRAL